jgi:hypothetical protein
MRETQEFFTSGVSNSIFRRKVAAAKLPLNPEFLR